MSLYSSSYLKGLEARLSFNTKQRFFTESANESGGFDIFLSHSFLDKDEVEGIYYELSNQGFKVYVDWITDKHLDRKNVTEETAKKIRNRMKSSRSLVFAISENAEMSKWMPWELGFMDGHTGQCVILPVSKSAVAPKTFKRTEYLLLYPYMKRAELSGVNNILITESGNSYTYLGDWVKRSVKPSFKSLNVDFL